MKIRRLPVLSIGSQARFWVKVAVRRDRECWHWKGTANKEGRGLFRIGPAMYYAPRIAYELAYGRLSTRKTINHSCDRPSCCNPAHLWSGTQLDGIRDMLAKKRSRHARGTSHGRSQLTPAQVRSIRKSNKQQKVLAQCYRVSPSLISAICRRVIWRHIP